MNLGWESDSPNKGDSLLQIEKSKEDQTQVLFGVPTKQKIWEFPKIGVGPQNVWFIMKNPIKMDDLG